MKATEQREDRSNHVEKRFVFCECAGSGKKRKPKSQLSLIVSSATLQKLDH